MGEYTIYIAIAIIGDKLLNKYIIGNVGKTFPTNSFLAL
jgi:hypothetical protein